MAAAAAFKIGEKVVYPAHGVGVIEGVQTKVISGNERKFYMLRIIDSDMTIMIPTENVQSVGLRRIIGKDMVAKVYKILRDKKVEIDQQTWNRRYREYTEKIKTGSVLEIAKVLRDLFVLKGDKELSFGERKMLDTARNLLVKELAIAKSHSEDKIMEEPSDNRGNEPLALSVPRSSAVMTLPPELLDRIQAVLASWLTATLTGMDCPGRPVFAPTARVFVDVSTI